MRSRYAVAAVAALLLACLPITGASAGVPRTGFESRGGKGWTTLAEEAAYLQRLDAMSPRLRVVTIGRSTLGRPIRLLVVGPVHTQAQIATSSAAMFVCTQHGNEPAGREACLQRARDIAFGTSTLTVLIVPTANPDGVAANTRENAAGIDINRTFGAQSTPEARAIVPVLTAYRPDVLGDLHEYQAPGERYVRTRSDLLYGAGVVPAVRSFSLHLCHRYQEPAIQAGGYPTAPYPPHVIVGSLLDVSTRLRIITALTETPRAGVWSPRQRVDAQRRSIDGTLRFLAVRRIDLARVTR